MRPNSQTCRRSRTIDKEEENLILWLKFNNDFLDSSDYDQKTLANPLSPDGSPSFAEDVKYYGEASAHCIAGRSLAISGQGAGAPNAHLLDFGEGDFTIEAHVRFLDYPRGEEATLFDWGNLKLTNWSGVFSIYNPNEMNSVIDYYDENLRLDWEFNHIAVVRRDGLMNLVINGRTVTEDYVPHQITGLQEYDNIRIISSNLDGSNSFQGYLDEFKVHRSAIYGPEPCEVFDSIQVENLVIDDGEESSDERYMETLPLSKHRSVSFRTDVSTKIDLRSNAHSPLPYEVHWFKKSKDLFDSSSGPSTEAIYGEVVRVKHKNLIKIKKISESALLEAKVFFKKINIPSADSTFLELDDALGNFGEFDPLVLYWKEERTSSVLVSDGEDGSISVEALGGVAPYMFTWKRNGLKINEGPNVSIDDDGAGTSTITFKKVTHNISGITCEVEDGLATVSELYTEGSVLISTPKIIPPILTKLHPSDNARENLIVKKYRIESSENYHLASYQFNGWPAENVMFHIIAEDVNSELSNVGDLKYEWYVDGKWTSGGSFREFPLQIGQQSQVKCRISFTQRQDIFTYVIANINYPDDACELPTSCFSKYIPSNKTREELTVYTGELIPFSYYYVSSQDLADSSQNPKKFITSTSVDISAGAASSILNLDYRFSDDYLKTIDRIYFEKKFWLNDNDLNGEQNVKLTFSNSCGDKDLTSNVRVIKGKSVHGEISSGQTMVVMPSTTQQDQFLNGWISPQSTKKRRVYYRVLINGANVSDYRPIPDGEEKLSGSDATYKASCLELSFNKRSGSSAITPVSVKLNDQSSCWVDGDTLTLEFYNNLPAANDFANADKFSKTFTVRIVDPPEIDSPSEGSSRWTLVNQSSQASNGKEMNITWAYDHDNSEWLIYPKDHNSPEFNESFSQVPSAR